MRSRAEPLDGPVLEQGESPRWDARGNRLLWVDMGRGDLHVGLLDGAAIRLERSYHLGDSVGFAAPLANPGEGWICTRERDIVHVAEDGAIRVLAAEVAAVGTQFNDGACDPSGVLWAGTQSHTRTPDAALFSLDAAGGLRRRLDGVTVSNGLGFTDDGTRMYYIDTLPHRRLEAFDIVDGELAARRTLVEIEGGNPDGLAVDREGGVWVAVWDAGEVRHFDRDGALTRTVALAARRPSAVCLVDDLLIITTAHRGLSDPNPAEGGMFAIGVDVPGAPAAPWTGPVPTG